MTFRSPRFLLALIFTATGFVFASDLPSLRFEKEVNFKLGKPIELKAQVGKVKVSKVEFTTNDKASIVDKLSKQDSELSTTLRAGFEVENPDEDDWEVTFSIELLDKKGNPVDRWSQNKSFDTEARDYAVDHRIPKALLSLVDSVKIKLTASR